MAERKNDTPLCAMDSTQTELCTACQQQGSCRMWFTKQLSKSETEDSEIVRLVRNLACELLEQANVSPMATPGWLATQHAWLDMEIVDDFGNPVNLKTKYLSPPDDVIDTDKFDVWNELMRDYMRRTFHAPVPANVIPHVRNVNRELFIVCGTLFAAMAPDRAITWPRHY